MPGEALIEQLTELLLRQLKGIATDEDDLRRCENDVRKLTTALAKFKRSKQVRKLIEDVRPYMESLPNFYGDFYSIITHKLCYSSYAAKFFDLVDVILSSSHIPVYIVAAYVKKLARILLTAPLACQLPIITLIKNVLYRHRIVYELLVNRKEPGVLRDDPFDMSERDLIKCNAKDSSLWEFRSIQQHWLYKVADKAAFLDRPAPDEDVPLIWQNSDELFENLVTKATLKLKRLKEATYSEKRRAMFNDDDCDNDSEDDVRVKKKAKHSSPM